MTILPGDVLLGILIGIRAALGPHQQIPPPKPRPALPKKIKPPEDVIDIESRILEVDT